jgi:two-component system LytT family response regulator
MKTLRVLIADDEPAARRKLVRLLDARADVELVGQAANGREAVDAIRRTNPDLVLLDVQMPALDGFEALAAVRTTNGPRVVFVTAFDRYAVRAFEVRAFDYLLKPFDGPRLNETLDRVRRDLEIEQSGDAFRVAELFDGLRREPVPVSTTEAPRTRFVERVCVRSAGRAQFVRIADVDWFESFGNYVRLHTAGARVLLRSTMRQLVAQLDPSCFARIHRCATVNLDRVVEMRPSATSGDYVVLLASGVRLRLSRSFRPEFDRKLGRR